MKSLWYWAFQGPTRLIVNENSFLLKAAQLHKATTNGENQMVFSLVLSQAATWWLKNAVN